MVVHGLTSPVQSPVATPACFAAASGWVHASALPSSRRSAGPSSLRRAPPGFAVAVGVLIANVSPAVAQQKSLRISTLASLCLNGGIVLLGAGPDLGAIVRTGIGSPANIDAGAVRAVLPVSRIVFRIQKVLGKFILTKVYNPHKSSFANRTLTSRKRRGAKESTIDRAVSRSLQATDRA